MTRSLPRLAQSSIARAIFAARGNVRLSARGPIRMPTRTNVMSGRAGHSGDAATALDLAIAITAQVSFLNPWPTERPVTRLAGAPKVEGADGRYGDPNVQSREIGGEEERWATASSPLNVDAIPINSNMRGLVVIPTNSPQNHSY